MSMCDIHQTLETIQNLPTLPVVAQDVLKLIANPISNMGQIADVITRDQAISARVIRLTNSAFYGFSNRISSIQHAIVILGLNTIKNLALGVSVVRTFEEIPQKTSFDREQFWLHSFSTALGSKLLAKRLQKKDDEDYFLAGLLHDIGILVVDQFLHDHFVEIMKYSEKNNSDYIASEFEVLGMTHGEVGSFLGSKWKLPQYLNSCMKFHHSPRQLSETAMWDAEKIAFVHISDARAREVGIGQFVPNYTTACDEQVLKKIEVPESDIEEIFKKVKDETMALMQEWGL